MRRSHRRSNEPPRTHRTALAIAGFSRPDRGDNVWSLPFSPFPHKASPQKRNWPPGRPALARSLVREGLKRRKGKDEARPSPKEASSGARAREFRLARPLALSPPPYALSSKREAPAASPLRTRCVGPQQVAQIELGPSVDPTYARNGHKFRRGGRADRRVERSGARIAIQRAKSLSERVASGSKCSDSTDVSNAGPFNGL